ncbi:MAG: DUF1501 domain-containing protein [Pirellulales bacterium]
MPTPSNTREWLSPGRRRFLQTSVLLPFGWQRLVDRCAADAPLAPLTRRAKSCILLWLDGGPSHLETFDPKPDAPAEVRGPCRPISTSVPGVQLSEWLPRTAQHADKLAIVRSITSPLGEHGLANHYVLTGYKPSPVLQYPSLGSVVARMQSQPALFPPYIAIPDARGMVGAGFLGATYEPFATGGDPGQAEFRVRDMQTFPGVDEARVRRRQDYLSQLDRSSGASTDANFAKAFELTLSDEARRAFTLADEPESVRARYGPRTFGQSCLLARRLVERETPFVAVHFPGWDTHENMTLALRDGYSGAKVGVGLVPTFDQAMGALLSDLRDRGLLDQTLVVAMGEFGRTPKINARAGRDHWPRVFSAVFAGGGVPGGQVIGASDRFGESPAESPVTPNDLVRTIYTKLGIDPDHELITADGRPIPLNQGGQVVSALL